MSDKVTSLEARVKELEQEVASREEDLKVFREQLGKANKKLESIIGRVNQEIKTAMTIQKVLVPTDIPNISGIEFSYKFVPSLVKGGDYFDIFSHEDKFKFGIIVAASSGHTMSSMLLSVLLKISGQIEARKGASPHKVVQYIIDELQPTLTDSDRAELFYAVIDRRTFEVEYCRQGGVLAYHQSYETNKVTPLTSTGDSLARQFEIPQESKHLLLNPRDRLIVATPGVIENQNLQGEEFGEERLVKSIYKAPTQGVHELRNEIFLQSSQFLGGCEAKRDQTILISEVKDRVIKLASH